MGLGVLVWAMMGNQRVICVGIATRLDPWEIRGRTTLVDSGRRSYDITYTLDYYYCIGSNLSVSEEVQAVLSYANHHEIESTDRFEADSWDEESHHGLSWTGDGVVLWYATNICSAMC